MAVARITVRHRAAFLVRREHPAVRALALVGLVVLWELFTRLGWVPCFYRRRWGCWGSSATWRDRDSSLST
jgi:hypothetical protein